MAGAFGCSISDLDQPEEIYIEQVPNSNTLFEMGEKIFSVKEDGFVRIVLIRNPR